MAITYTYMHTNTPFNANALNLRFEPFMGADTGLNKLTLDELSLGAFRHNLTPRLLHTAEISTESLIAKAAITDPSSDYFSTRRDYSFSATSDVAGSVMTVDYKSYPVQLNMNTSENVGAILVMANLDITKIVTVSNGVEQTPHEDVGYVVAFIRLVDSGSNELDLLHTRRALSPRLTIRTTGGTILGPSLFGDANTNQDVSIRTVVTQADLGALVDVAKVELVISVFGSGDSQVAKVGKGNLTAIPLHAKVN
jgi:hypothetical protein